MGDGEGEVFVSFLVVSFFVVSVDDFLVVSVDDFLVVDFLADFIAGIILIRNSTGVCVDQNRQCANF